MQTPQIKFLKNLTKYALHYEYLSFFISKPHTIKKIQCSQFWFLLLIT